MHHVAFLFLGLCLLLSCGSSGAAESPEKAFENVFFSFQNNDVLLLEKNLSSRSLEKISLIRGKFSAMEPAQRNAAAAYWGLMPEQISRMSAGDFISLIIGSQKNVLFGGNNAVAQVQHRSEFSASVFLFNGTELSFVKENSGWKFDLDDL